MKQKPSGAAEKSIGEWPAGWTAQIGAGVRELRDMLGMSAAQLSDRCAKLGNPIPRNSITNLENGRKSTIPLHELHTLASALKVPMTSLAFWPNPEGYVELSPGNFYVAGTARLASYPQEPRTSDDPRGLALLDAQGWLAEMSRAWIGERTKARQAEREAQLAQGAKAESARRQARHIHEEMEAIARDIAPLWVQWKDERWMQSIPEDFRDALMEVCGDAHILQATKGTDDE